MLYNALNYFMIIQRLYSNYSIDYGEKIQVIYLRLNSCL